jgi:hypothetical protein
MAWAGGQRRADLPKTELAVASGIGVPTGEGVEKAAQPRPLQYKRRE